MIALNSRISRNSINGLISVIVLACIANAGSGQTVSSAHPRFWLTPARLAKLKNFAGRNTRRWQNVKTAADKALTLSGSIDYAYIPVLGIAYQVTGDTRYANRAITALMSEAVSTNTLTTDSYYNFRFGIPNISAGYDWCYDQMTTAQRQQVAKWLMDRADNVWSETNPARAGGWGLDDPTGNYFYGFLTTWGAALVAYGDDPTTSGTVSSPNRPQYHLRAANL